MQAKGSTCEIRTKTKPTSLMHFCNSQWAFKVPLQAFNYIPYTHIKAIIKCLRQARAALRTHTRRK